MTANVWQKAAAPHKWSGNGMGAALSALNHCHSELASLLSTSGRRLFACYAQGHPPLIMPEGFV